MHVKFLFLFIQGLSPWWKAVPLWCGFMAPWTMWPPSDWVSPQMHGTLLWVYTPPPRWAIQPRAPSSRYESEHNTCIWEKESNHIIPVVLHSFWCELNSLSVTELRKEVSTSVVGWHAEGSWYKFPDLSVWGRGSPLPAHSQGPL